MEAAIRPIFSLNTSDRINTMLHDEIAELYINDGNYELAEKLIEELNQSTVNAIEILRKVRAALLKNNLKFETFSFNELEDMLKADGLNPKVVDHILAGLSSYFDEFEPLDFTAIENFEKRLIALDIAEQYIQKKLKEQS